jgi:hypothetical protein
MSSYVYEFNQKGHLPGGVPEHPKILVSQISICDFINLRKAKLNAPEKQFGVFFVVRSWFQINSFKN